jgi:hypothetical protein
MLPEALSDVFVYIERVDNSRIQRRLDTLDAQVSSVLIQLSAVTG